MIWCGYGRGKDKQYGRNRNAGVHEKKIIFRLLVSEEQISAATEAIRQRAGDNGSGCVSPPVSRCVCVPMRSRTMPRQQGPCTHGCRTQGNAEAGGGDGQWLEAGLALPLGRAG